MRIHAQIFLILIVVLLSLTSHAQNERHSLRVHFGYALSNTMWNGGETDFKSTFNAGIEIRRRLGQTGFHLQSGIRWNEYGFRDESQAWISNGEFFTIYDFVYSKTYFFLTLPLIATYKFDKVVTGLSLSAGPQLSFYIFDRFQMKYEQSVLDDETSFGVGDYPISSLGFHFSVGYERYISDRWLLGGEVYSNLNFPIGWFFGLDGDYNFGIGISGRYILKQDVKSDVNGDKLGE